MSNFMHELDQILRKSNFTRHALEESYDTVERTPAIACAVFASAAGLSPSMWRIASEAIRKESTDDLLPRRKM